MDIFFHLKLNSNSEFNEEHGPITTAKQTKTSKIHKTIAALALNSVRKRFYR